MLASRILRSLELEQGSTDRGSAAELIGLWKTDRPPTDEEIDQIIEEERLKKHALTVRFRRPPE
jgi:hypothetical protein